MERFNLFSLDSEKDFAQKVANHLGVTLSPHEERNFEDGEHKTRPLVNVRGNNVYVIQSLYSEEKESVNDKLCKLLFFIGALKDASAAKVTAVIPYLCYARKDRKTKDRDPVTTRYVAGLFESVRTDHVITLDVHNLQAFQNSFRCNTDHLDTIKLFGNHLNNYEENDITLLAPDFGAAKRTDKVREFLSKLWKKEVSMAIMEKERSAGVIKGSLLAGEVKDKTVVIIDDLISSGNTLVKAAQASIERGAVKIIAAATHGVFSSEAEGILKNSPIQHLVVTNTIKPRNLSQDFISNKLQVLDTTPLFASVIKAVQEGGSLVDILKA